MSLKAILVVAALSLAALAPRPAQAAHFDFIYYDQYDLTLGLNGCGITLAGNDFGLVVNKGLTDITGPEFFAPTFTVTSSEPSILLLPFNTNPGFPAVTPIHPNEAVGGGGPLASPLPSLLQPGETYHNTTGYQVIAFEVTRTSGSYAGPVTFNVAMKMGAETASFTLHFDVRVGPHAISFLSAARTSSVSGPTPVAQTTWGRLKSMYR